MGRSFTERLNAGKKKKRGALIDGVNRRASDGSHKGPGSALSDISSEAGSLSQFSRAPSFSYSETQSQNGRNNADTAPPAFVPRNLLLEAKREIRVLQERCRELECGFNDLKEDNVKLRDENSRFLQQVGKFEGQVSAAQEERQSLAAEVKSTKQVQEDLKQEIETAKRRQNLLLEEIKSPRGSECLSPHSMQQSPIKGRHAQVYSSVAYGIALLAVPVAAVAAFRSRVA